MGEEESKKVEFEKDVVVIGSSGKQDNSAPNSENALVPVHQHHHPLPPKTPPILKKVKGEGVEKSSGDSINRNTALAKVVADKKLALVKAWEESQKTKADNKACKRLSAIGAWENTKKALVEIRLLQIQEGIEKEKAAKVEKMKNKVAMIHKAAEEKRALVQAKKGEDILKVEEVASKFRSTGTNPMTIKFFKCFGF